jgi:hypothetical protein
MFGRALLQLRSTLLLIGFALQFTYISYSPAVGALNAVAGKVSSTRLRAKSLDVETGFQAFITTV